MSFGAIQEGWRSGGCHILSYCLGQTESKNLWAVFSILGHPRLSFRVGLWVKSLQKPLYHQSKYVSRIQLGRAYENFLQTSRPILSHKIIRTGSNLVAALVKHPDIIPLKSYPQAVYFLLNLDNFLRSWHLWLGYSLEFKEYNVSDSLVV